MKKILLAGVAASALMSAPVLADVEITGQWMGGIMVGNVDDASGTTLSDGTTDATVQPGQGNRSSNFWQESEVVFTSDADIAGGWNAKVSITLEGETDIDATTSAAKQIDETFVTFAHPDFGRFELGNRNVAGYRMVPFAASAGFEPNGGAANRVTDGLTSTEKWSPTTGSRNILTLEEIGIPAAPSGAATGDSTKMSYITPRIYGMQVGVSYMPDACETGINGNDPVDCDNTGGLESQNENFFTNAGVGNGYSVGINQALPLSMLGLGNDGLILVGGSYSYSQVEQATLLSAGNTTSSNYFVSEDFTEWNAGAMLKVAGFKLSGTYIDRDLGPGAPTVSAWQLGATYKTGDWEFGANYAKGKAERPEKSEVVSLITNHSGAILFLDGSNQSSATAQALVNNSTYSFGGTDTMSAYEVASNYDLGAGVKLIGAIRHYDAEHGLKAAAGTYEKTLLEVGTKINF